jgi:hypothetical protein
MKDKNWWRHEFKEIETDHPLGPITQQCIHCGIQRQWTADYWYMRIIGWKWYPKISPKCPNRTKPE